jgi:fused signal recognition particle receptor
MPPIVFESLPQCSSSGRRSPPRRQRRTRCAARRVDAAATDSDAGPVLSEALAEVPRLPRRAPTVNASTRTSRSPAAKRRSKHPPSAAGANGCPAIRSRGLSTLFVRHPKLDDDLLDELETTLITPTSASKPAPNWSKTCASACTSANSPMRPPCWRVAPVADRLLKPVEKPLDIRGHKSFRGTGRRHQRRRQDHHHRQTGAPMARRKAR